MKSKWWIKKISDVFEVTSSKRVHESDWGATGIPFYRAREVVKLARDGKVENKLFISPELYQKNIAQKGKPSKGDLIVSGVGSLGHCYAVKSDDKFYFKDASVLWFRKKDEVCTKYIEYLFKSDIIMNQIVRYAVGATVGTLTISKAKEIKIPLPPLEDQKRIVKILDQADALRQKRKQAIELLDEYVKSVFLEMFGDPAYNHKNYSVKIIGDLVSEVKYGTSNKAEKDGKYPYLRMNNITYGGELDPSNLKYINLTKEEEPKYLAKKGDILFNRTNSKELVGKTAIFDLDVPMAIAGYLIRVRTNEFALPEYVSGYLNSKHGKKTLENMCKNIVGMANINAKELQKIKILMPEIAVQIEYKKTLDRAKQLKQKMLQQYQELDNQFQALMQRSFRGEL